MQQAPYDPRAVANKLLDMAALVMEKQATITPLALQKLLYFAHARYLAATGTPAVKGAFEAWQYGPVHPTVYKAFSDFGKTPITSRAKAKNLLTGEERELAAPEDWQLNRAIMSVLLNVGHLSAGRLVELSHAKNGPWYFIWEKLRKGEVVTRHIPDEVTRERGNRMFMFASHEQGDSPNGEEVPPQY